MSRLLSQMHSAGRAAPAAPAPTESAPAAYDDGAVQDAKAHLDRCYGTLLIACRRGYLPLAALIPEADVRAIRQIIEDGADLARTCRQVSRLGLSDPRRGADVLAACVLYAHRWWLRRMEQAGGRIFWYRVRVDLLFAHCEAEKAAGR